MDDSSCIPQKQCFKCREFFPATHDFFYTNNSTKDHLATRCKKCFHVRNTKPPEGYKHCPVCNQDLPQTMEYFHMSKDRSDGLTALCKACRLEKQHVFYTRARKQGEKIKPDTMICGRCGVEKLATLQFFTMNPLCRYGLNTICKTCTNARQVELNRRDPEIQRLKWRKEYQQSRLYYINRYQQKRDQILFQQHTFAFEHPEIVRGWKRRYAKSDRGHEIGRARENRRRAYKKLAPGELTPEQVQSKLKAQKYRCYYGACGHAKFKKVDGRYVFHLEHTIPLSRPEAGPRHDVNYIVLSCPSCNFRKHNKLPSEWPEGGRLF